MSVDIRRPLAVRRLGLVAYSDGVALQEELVRQRRAGEVPDTLLILEHPPVITLGSTSDPRHVLVTPPERARRGIELFETGRGGDVTFHGPGQLVAYPILDLKPDRKDLHAYLRDLEEVVIAVAADWGVRADRSEGATGVWTETGKLAALGVRVSSGWITSHGLALNVSADLAGFDTIVPCGIADRGVTSLSGELGRAVDIEAVAETLVERFAQVFERQILVG